MILVTGLVVSVFCIILCVSIIVIKHVMKPRCPSCHTHFISNGVCDKCHKPLGPEEFAQAHRRPVVHRVP